MAKKIIKRSYNFPSELIKAWEDFHAPSKDFSPSAAGAFLIWMALPADIREKARQAAHSASSPSALASVKEELAKSLTDRYLNRWLTGLSEDQYQVLLTDAQLTAQKLARKKKGR